MITLDHAYHGHVISQIDISPYKFNKPGGAGCPPCTYVAPVPDVYRGKHRDLDFPGQDMGEVSIPLTATIMSLIIMLQVYATEVDRLIADMAEGPAAFIAESFQSCGGQIIFPDS